MGPALPIPLLPEQHQNYHSEGGERRMDTSSYYTLGTLGTPGSSLSLSLLHTYACMYGTRTQVETRSECVFGGTNGVLH